MTQERVVVRNSEDSLQIKSLNRKIQEITSEHDQTCVKLRSMQSGYHQVITVAAELVQSLAACINGEKMTPAYLGDIAKRLSALRKNPPALKMPSESQIPATKGSIHKPVIPPVQSNNLSTRQLDFNMIRNELNKNPDDLDGVRRQAFLLQALRMVSLYLI